MKLYVTNTILPLFIAICQDIVGEVLDTGTLYVPIHGSYHLKCQNKTDGRFNSLVWRTSAYSKAKHDVYTYIEKKKEDIYSSFIGRIKRYDGTSIHIHNAQPEDSGNWECNILYNYKLEGDERWRLRVSVLAVYDLVVISPPTISRRYPELVSVPIGFRTNVFCDAHGLSPFNLTWSKENGEFSKHVRFVVKQNMKGRYISKRTFMYFEKLSAKDVGIYTCTAQNMAGKMSRTIETKIQVRPKITSKKEWIAHEGDKGMMLCNATGYPKVHFRWNFVSNLEHINLKSGESRGKFSVSKTSYTSSDDTTYALSILYVRNVQREDWRQYTCNVESTLGYDRKDITLSGYSLPSPPMIIPRNRIFPNQVELKWEHRDDGGTPIKSITVQYKSNLMNHWSTIQISRPLSKYTVTNLEPNSIYDFRVLSTNRVGNSKYSEIFQVHTSTEEQKIVQQKQTIGELGIISFIGVCGAALVGLTCAVGCICLYFQERRINRYQVNRQESRSAQTSVSHY